MYVLDFLALSIRQGLTLNRAVPIVGVFIFASQSVRRRSLSVVTCISHSAVLFSQDILHVWMFWKPSPSTIESDLKLLKPFANRNASDASSV